MRTDKTICLNYFKDNGEKRSLQDRVYHTGGGSINDHNLFSLQHPRDCVREFKFYQYPRGVNQGGILQVRVCPTISCSSWQNNCFLIEIEYEQQEADETPFR